jgi:hypothetical protein
LGAIITIPIIGAKCGVALVALVYLLHFLDSVEIAVVGVRRRADEGPEPACSIAA